MGSLKTGFGLKSLLLLIHLVLAAALPPAARLLERAAPLDPSADPFYTPPPGYENSAPGTILRTRNVPSSLALASILPINIHGAYQLLYRTTDSLGNPQATVTTVIVPYDADPKKILSYQFAEDGAWINCAPSYVLQQGSNIVNGGTSAPELLFIIAALNQGWVVNTPDYEGPKAAFTSGIQSGQAVLDSVRAALSSGEVTGISSSAVYQMWGYSGGSLATEWASELQPSYAPELNFAGVAVGGLVPNISSVVYTVNKGPFSGLVPSGIMGLYHAYPDLADYVDANLIPSKAAEFKKAQTQCIDVDFVDYAFQDVFSYFTSGESLLNGAVAQAVLNVTGNMGTHGTPKMPMFFYKAVADEVSPVTDTDALVNKLCSQGAQIQYVRDGLGEHVTEIITGAGDAFVFLKDRFDGIPAALGCSTSNVLLDALNLPALEALGATVADALLAILLLPIGEIGLRRE